MDMILCGISEYGEESDTFNINKKKIQILNKDIEPVDDEYNDNNSGNDIDNNSGNDIDNNSGNDIDKKIRNVKIDGGRKNGIIMKIFLMKKISMKVGQKN